MVKNYKLALTGLLISCALSNAMEKEKNDKGKGAIFYKELTEEDKKSKEAFEQSLKPDHVNKLADAFEEKDVNACIIQREIKESISNYKSNSDFDDISYANLRNSRAKAMLIKAEAEAMLIKAKSRVKNAKAALLEASSKTDARTKRTDKIEAIVKAEAEKREVGNKLSMAVVVSNPWYLNYGVYEYKKYPNVSDTKRQLIKEQLMQIVGGQKAYQKTYHSKPLGYIICNVTKDKKSLLRKISGVAKVGLYENLNIPGLSECRNAGNTTLDGIFQK